VTSDLPVRDTLRIYTSIAVSIKRNTKTNTNPNPDPNRYRRRCPDPNARIQKTEDLQIRENGKYKIEIAKNIEVYILNTTRL